MTAKQLTELGQALFGTLWQSETARALGVSDRTIRRWLTAGRPLPEGIEQELRAVARERAAEIERLVG